MQIFNVILHEGSYSDQNWSLMGSFSSQEKAEEYIDRITTPDPVPPEEQILASYEKYKNDLAEGLIRQREQHEERRAEILAARNKLFERAMSFPEFSAQRAKLQVQANEFGRATIDGRFSKGPPDPYVMDLDAWKQWHRIGVPVVCRTDLSIEETELDQMPVFREPIRPWLVDWVSEGGK